MTQVATSAVLDTNEELTDDDAIGQIGPSAGRRALSYLLLTVLTVLFVAPIAFMFIGSLKPSEQVLNGLGGFVPRDLSLDNYKGVFDRFNSAATGYFSWFFFTSVLVASVIVIVGLVVNSMIAYALARLQWRGRNLSLTAVVLLVILPFEAIAVPLFYMLADYRNTYYVQFLPFIANAFSIYLFYTFFVSLPKQIEEAARVDGAGPWKTFFLIALPMSKPVFATVTILQFLAAWGAFLWPVMVVDQPKYRPLPLAISVFQGQPPIDWGQIFAFGVMMSLPVLIVFLVFQRWFIQSVATSGLKG
jgi:multiple sugar transport system permease protein